MSSPAPRPADDSPRLDRWLRGAMEAVVIAMVVASPWPFGSNQPVGVFGVRLALALLLLLWAARIVVRRRFEWRGDAVALCLGGLVCLSAVQLLPLPESVLSAAAPSTRQTYRDFLPA